MKVKNLIRKLIVNTLASPIVFDLQQKVFNNYSVVRREFADILDVNGRTIIDIGCSTGACAAAVINMTTNRYTGIDIDPAYIATARARYPDGNFMAMDARRMGFQDNSFDVGMLIGVLHHMDDQLIHDCLRELWRVIKTDGKVLVAEPVFTPGRWFSNLLLELDRGRFIRSPSSYRELFIAYRVVRERFFEFSFHRFCSFVLEKDASLKLNG